MKLLRLLCDMWQKSSFFNYLHHFNDTKYLSLKYKNYNEEKNTFNYNNINAHQQTHKTRMAKEIYFFARKNQESCDDKLLKLTVSYNRLVQFIMFMR